MIQEGRPPFAKRRGTRLRSDRRGIPGVDGQTTRYTCPTRHSRGRGNPEGRPSGRVSPLARALQNYLGSPFTGEMSEGQRGPLQDDQAKNATDKSFAKVSLAEEMSAPKRGPTLFAISQ